MMRTRQKIHTSLYPNWQKKIDSPTRLAKIRDGQRCVDCDVADRTLITDELGQPLYILYLHGAHLHPLDPEFYRVEPIDGQRLRARCPRCHGRYDHKWKRRAEEVEHQRLLHSILRSRWVMQRFCQVV